MPDKPSPDADNNAFLKRFARAKANRDKVAPVLDDCYEYALPLRERVYSNGQDYRARTERLFDDTAGVAVQDGASRMLDDVFPTDAKPFELTIGSDVDPAQAEEVNRALAPITEMIVQVIANSNFRSAANEALMDWHIAKGILTIEPGDAINPINCRCIPLTEALIDLGPKGDADCLYRTLKVRAADIEHRWTDATLPEDLRKIATDQPDQEVELIEGAWRDWSDKGNETWCLRVVWKTKTLYDRRESGSGSKPFVDFDYARVPGHVLGRGPVQAVLADIKTLNLVKEMSLEAMDLALSGVYTAEDDGVLNVDTIEIAPRTIIPVAQGSGGLKRIDDATDLRSAEWLIKTLSESIRRTIDGDELGPVKNSPMSATEVLERSSARARRRAGPYSRLIVELLGQTVQRVVYILKKRGRLRAEFPSVDGRDIAIRPLAPLTRSMAQDEILRTVRCLETANATMGPQIAQMVFKQEDLVRWFATKFGVDPNLVRTSVELKELAAQIAQLSAAAPAGQPPMAA